MSEFFSDILAHLSQQMNTNCGKCEIKIYPIPPECDGKRLMNDFRRQEAQTSCRKVQIEYYDNKIVASLSPKVTSRISWEAMGCLMV